MLDLIFGDPLGSVISFYIIVFAAAEIARNAVDFVSPSGMKVYLYEAIGTMTMCLCVFENGFMLAYGYIPFFLTVSVVLYLGARFNRGAQVSPLSSFEAIYYGSSNIAHIVGILLSQFIAAMGAFLLVGHIWIMSKDYLKFHAGKAEDLYNCNIKYKVPFTYVVVFEFLGCALIRVLVPIFSTKLPNVVKTYLIPAFISGMITSSIYLLGAAGLNPVVASCRLMWCGGIDKQWFILLYWVISTVGFLFGSMVSHFLSPPAKAKKGRKEESTKAAKQKIETKSKRSKRVKAD